MELISRPTRSPPIFQPSKVDAVSHKAYTLVEFANKMVQNSVDLIMEELSDDPPLPMVQFEFAKMKCPHCDMETMDYSKLLDHHFDHFSSIERARFEQWNLILKDSDAVLTEILEEQSRNSFVKKKIENAKCAIRCPLSSPLAQYLAMDQMRVYLNKPPVARIGPNRKYLMVELERVDKTHKLFFDFTCIEHDIFKHRTLQKNIGRKRKINYSAQACHVDAFYSDYKETETPVLKTENDNNDLLTNENLLNELMQETKTRSERKKILELIRQ